jgi:hypothetical protein
MSKIAKNWEKYRSLFIAIFITMFTFFFKVEIYHFKEATDKLSELSKVFISLIGFFITILTMIQTMNSRPMMFIRQSGNFKTLLSYIITSIKLQFLTILYTLVYPYLTDYGFIKQHFLIFILTWCFFSSFFFTLLLMKIIKSAY